VSAVGVDGQLSEWFSTVVGVLAPTMMCAVPTVV